MVQGGRGLMIFLGEDAPKNICNTALTTNKKYSQSNSEGIADFTVN